MAEIYLQKKFLQSTTKLCIGRIFSFTDHNQKIPYVIPSIASKIKKSNRKLVLKNLNHYRDFLSTKDIVKCINHLNKKKIGAKRRKIF